MSGAPGDTNAEAARDVIVDRLRAELAEPPIEAQFTSLDLLVALAGRYGLQAYGRKGQRKTTMQLALPEAFTREVFEPIVVEMSRTLHV